LALFLAALLYIHYGDVDTRFCSLNFDGDVQIIGNMRYGSSE